MRRSILSAVLVIFGIVRLDAAPRASSEFSFEFQDGLIWVAVISPQSAKPLNFVLDTGAEVSVIDWRVAQRLGLRLGKRVRVREVNAVTDGYWPENLPAQLGGVPLPGKELAVDLAPLSRACARPVDGLVGADFFRKRIVRIDFESKRIRLLNSAPEGRSRSAPLKVRHGAICVQIRVNGSPPRWVRLDTGCATALQWVDLPRALRGGAARLAVGLTRNSIPQSAATVSIGQWQCEQTPTGLHHQPIFPGEYGLLGNGLLRRFSTVTIDAKDQRLILGDAHRSAKN